MDDLWRELISLGLTAFVSVVGWFFARAMVAVRQRYGAQTEQILRDELAKALERALSASVARAGGAKARFAVDYLHRTMPDSLRRLKVSDDALIRRVEAELSARQSTEPGARK